jgi:hypothetical protein
MAASVPPTSASVAHNFASIAPIGDSISQIFGTL